LVSAGSNTTQLPLPLEFGRVAVLELSTEHRFRIHGIRDLERAKPLKFLIYKSCPAYPLNRAALPDSWVGSLAATSPEKPWMRMWKASAAVATRPASSTRSTFEPVAARHQIVDSNAGQTMLVLRAPDALDELARRQQDRIWKMKFEYCGQRQRTATFNA
jgi:hypothetical protein